MASTHNPVLSGKQTTYLCTIIGRDEPLDDLWSCLVEEVLPRLHWLAQFVLELKQQVMAANLVSIPLQ